MDPNPPLPKPFIIPIFLPHTGCPHRCIFCDQSAITGQPAAVPRAVQIRRDIKTFLEYSNGRRTPVQISFYGGNFLGQPEKTVGRLLEVASEFIAAGTVDSLRFSTRPDTIDPERIGWLRGHRVATVEIGVQSMDDRILQNANRGHTARDTEHAVGLLRAAGFETGLQMMVGLPGDTDSGAMETGRRIQALSPDFVRIYPTLVLKHSRLADRFMAGRYVPLPLEAAVGLTARLYRLFINGGTRVIRMGLQASAALNQAGTILAGPYHPAFGQLVMAKLFYDGVCRALAGSETKAATISIAVNPRSVSNLKGQKNLNLDMIKHRFAVHRVTVRPDPVLAETVVVVNAGDPVSILHRDEPL